ncbi:type IV pilus secretin PilQ [Nitrospira moscoviensis]|uniref:Putative Type IV pili biogenesis protein PilQ n=1 Tax=Nitrospira moscoviensis TaxID=42253 RepID=A0A0K2G9X9_NITMO|nr:type IV pilus secretin PilQ [Nitrospira moscoviensis]ALA57674.1 putative Type IV pili biogenesis protein PilQ [Nitrospira moscoviensis]
MKPLLFGANPFLSTVRLAGIAGLLGMALTAQADVTTSPDERRAMGGLGAAQAANAPVEAPAQTITQVEVRPEGNQVTVVVLGDGKLFPEARMVDDDRLVIDLLAVASALRTPVVRAHHPLLRKVRVGHHADKVRLVLDLIDRPAYSVSQAGRELSITLKPAESETIGGDGRPAAVIGTRPEHALFQPGVQRATRVVGPASSRFRVQPVQMAADGGAPEKDNRPDDIVAGQTRFVGRRISLDFQQADITNILRLIAEVSGFNIVVGEGVKAKVTMKLVSVPWDQALDMLLKMNGLGMIRQGTIVWVDTLANIAKQQDEEARAKDSKTKAEELVDRVFYIRNLQAQELMTSLRQYLSPRGVMQVSPGSNALIIRETETKLAVMKQLVDGLDLEVPQVQIEARIVQADTVYARGLGIQWGVKNSDFGTNSFSLVGNVTGPFAAASGLGAGASTTATITRDFLVNLPAQVGGLPAVPAIGWTFGKLADGFALDMRLSAGELLGLTKVIAAPKITTLDKREAKISQGESIPFQTTSLQGTQTTFVDANLELNVTPQITSRDPKEIGKTILLRVRATRNAVGARSNPAGPSIDRREATTQVIVRDGETMVIGGVFVDTQNNNVQGVPYLSRIPVLGWLFKNKSESVSKQELLIFLTPTIVKA